ARLRMLRGDLAGGLEELLEAGRRFEAGGGRNPAFMAWRSKAALALLQLGERREAGGLAGEGLELARAWGASRAARRAPPRGGAGGERQGGSSAARGGGRRSGRLTGEARARQGANRARCSAPPRKPPPRTPGAPPPRGR